MRNAMASHSSSLRFDASEADLLLTWPAVLFLILAPFALVQLWRKPTVVDGWPLKIAKLVAYVILAALELTRAIHGTQRSPSPTHALVAGTLATVAALVAGVVSALSHSRSLRPSTLLNVALLISAAIEGAILRLTWLSTRDRISRCVGIALVVFKGVLTITEAMEKRAFFLNDSDRQISREATSGIFSKSFLWWVNPLLLQGFHKPLTAADLYPLDRPLEAEFLHAKFEHAWNRSTAKKRRLLGSVIRASGTALFAPVIPRTVLIAFTVSQPLLVRRALEFLQNKEIPQHTGTKLVGAYAIVYAGMAITSSIYWTKWSRGLTIIRGMLSTAVFHHTTMAPLAVSEDKAALTLMSTDIDRITSGIRDIHELWANTIQIGIATYLLQIELGYACVAPVVICTLAFATITYLSRWTKVFQKRWMGQVQRRVALIASVLGSIRGVKMSGLSPQLTRLVSRARFKEVESSGDFRRLGVLTSTIALCPLMLSPVLAFALYAAIMQYQDVTLDVSRLFMSLSILLLLTQPLFSLFGSLVNAQAAISCIERIEQYLTSPSVEQKYSDTAPTLMDSSNSDHLLAIKLVDVSLGWSLDQEPVLSNVNVSISASSVNVLIGPSGSGKSTLLKGFLGEVPSAKGDIQVNRTGGLAFCSQTPWLWNGTIMENVIGFSDLNLQFYRMVLHACDLEKDLESLPLGDQTPVGSKGSSLSGGQKQRIAMARAVYQKSRVALFDDVFSGLDTGTSKAIWDRLFSSQGLLRRLQTTVILATHAVDILPLVDNIIALGNGKVVEQGSFSSLKKTNGYVDRLYAEYSTTRTEDNPSSEMVVPVEDDTISLTPNGNTVNKDVSSVPLAKKSDTANRSTSDWSIYRYYFRSIGVPSIIMFLFLEMLSAFFLTVPVIWLKWWTEANESHPNARLGYYLGIYTGLQGAGLAFSAVLTWFCFTFMARNSGIWLHDIALKTLMTAPMAFFDRTSIGSITTRFSQDIQMIDVNLPLQILTFVQNFFISIAQIGLIASGIGWVTVCFPVLFLVFGGVQICYLRSAKQMRLLDLSEKGPLYTQFLDTLGGLAVIRGFGWGSYLQTKNFELVDRSQRPYYLMFIIQRWLTLVLDLITMALAVLVVGLAVGLRENVSAGAIGVSLTQIISFTSYLKQLITTRTSLETTLGAIARLKEFSETTESEENPAAETQAPPEWPATGNVVFSHVSARYNSNSPHYALKDITLSIPAGKRIGICGRTGSGKSSLVLAMFRMIDVESGQLTIDGIDISCLGPQVVRSSLNGLGQEPYFLTGTVRENLDPYEAHIDEALVEALMKVHLWARIEAMGGLDAPLGTEALSHGQRQLFSLARALLRSSRIVVLDEVTSNIDQETDELMQQTIRNEFDSHTVISIAHRLDTIRNYDMVVVMEDGSCVEFDSPTSLLERPSRFKDLYETSQFQEESLGQ
ncbi:Multidrug resistance-associated protein 1 [Talaromyces islandicus]|uniref:Multidrug resistance-associated protein 1 n=1 Tax=Talaromyces islandicus TaxID=28573 RepID=A0A0U1M3N2_TALIS|nr:Multidrug resistance-associated protein 1 [Talaromyces islandicus]